MMKLLLGGSPCTYWSIAQTKNRETEASGLGWELFQNYLIARDKYKPDYFLYENNKSMSQAIREQITEELGVEPVLINSALVSAQNRQRLYWVGKRNPDGTYSQVEIEQPNDRGILLRDILETLGKPLSEREMDYMIRETSDGRNHFGYDYHHDATRPKSQCVTANTYRGVPYNVLVEPINTTINGKSQCLRATYYKDGIRNMVGNTVDRKTCVAEPIEYNPPRSCDVVITESSIRCSRHDKKHSTVQGSHVNFTDGRSQTLSPSHVPQVIEVLDRKAHPIYEVKDGLITIKGKQYPIKLRDGYYIIRKLTVTECKRLQTIPESFVFPVSDTQAYKMLGNGWTVDVILHIMSHFTGIKECPVEVLPMYDGMSCGRIALGKLGADVTRYYASEIDKYAIQTTQHNFPDTIQIGDAFQVRDSNWSLGGEPAYAD